MAKSKNKGKEDGGKRKFSETVSETFTAKCPYCGKEVDFKYWHMGISPEQCECGATFGLAQLRSDTTGELLGVDLRVKGTPTSKPYRIYAYAYKQEE